MYPFISLLVASLAILSQEVGAAPSSSLSKRCTNSATDRTCWSDSFDISTNYYDEVPDTGVTREVGSFDVSLEPS